MITLTDIINALVPDYKENNNITVSNDLAELFDMGASKSEKLLECILSSKRKTYDEVLRFLTNSTMNRNINRRKMISLIKNDAVNNELILFLSGYLDCNIWMYNDINKIYKVYYLEDTLQSCKDNLFIIETGGHYRVATPRFIEIEQLRDKYIVIPLGLKENKTWEKEVKEDNPLYKDLDTAEFVHECPDDPVPHPRFNMSRFFRRIKI
jgi:hypothetical protein